MAETLGSLCDKLTVIKLKQFHCEEQERLINLGEQEKQIQREIDEYVDAAIGGRIPIERLHFAANKIFKKEGNFVEQVSGSIGKVVSQLADTNCKLWHKQELVYEFENVPPAEKDSVVKSLALLNLERNNCIDEIDKQFRKIIQDNRLNSEEASDAYHS